MSRPNSKRCSRHRSPALRRLFETNRRPRANGPRDPSAGPDDRRAKRIVLTEHGYACVAAAMATIAELERDVAFTLKPRASGPTATGLGRAKGLRSRMDRQGQPQSGAPRAPRGSHLGSQTAPQEVGLDRAGLVEKVAGMVEKPEVPTLDLVSLLLAGNEVERLAIDLRIGVKHFIVRRHHHQACRLDMGRAQERAVRPGRRWDEAPSDSNATG